MLKRAVLGRSGIEVTEFCLGLLPMGPLQAKLPEEEQIKIIHTALKHGVRFFDTAEYYYTQPVLGKALRGIRAECVIATKSKSVTYEAMQESVQTSLAELETDVIDIYLMHAVAVEDFAKRAGALQHLLEMKEKGAIRAVGVSVHDPASTIMAAQRDDIDVILTIINKGFQDRRKEEMLSAIREAARRNKGIYIMKALGGGTLLQDVPGSLSFVRNIQEVHATALGIISTDELLMDLSSFGVEDLVYTPPEIKSKEYFVVPVMCIACGDCLEKCPTGSIRIIDNKAFIDKTNCVRCGYCSNCQEFAIRSV
ncbi:MAG: aldo/keto reductase [Clostridia bacterium]|nr:aldo/keto reductase [Clostridia bacterium]